MPKFCVGTLRSSRKSREKPFTSGASNRTAARIGSFTFEAELPATESAFIVSLNRWVPDSRCWRNFAVYTSGRSFVRTSTPLNLP